MALANMLPVRVRRWGYRLAHVALRIYWFLLRPRASGVKCVLRSGDRVLLVRHTYGRPEWEIPGGKLKRREQPELAAVREMHEELGIRIERWTPLGRVTGRADYRRDTLHCFQTQFDGRELSLDGGEIATAAWFPRAGLPPDVGGYVSRILALLDD